MATGGIAPAAGIAALSTAPSAFLRVGVALAGRDQAAQAVVDVEAPGAGAIPVALEAGKQADVGETDLGLVALPGDLEDHVRAVPLGLVLDEVDARVRDVPDDPLARHQLGDLLGAAVEPLVAVGELRAELVGAPVDLPRPPPTHVVDGVKDLVGRLVHRERGAETL